MSPDLGRFLQPDPIGFNGDASNLYRYCGNDPVDRTDPTGLYSVDAALSSLTSMGGGDWVDGSDGLSKWDRDHGMGMNKWQAAPGDNAGGGRSDRFPSVNPKAVLTAAEKYKSDIENAVRASQHTTDGSKTPACSTKPTRRRLDRCNNERPALHTRTRIR
jgi:uncharacterized protein RhaS with RHS repeats